MDFGEWIADLFRATPAEGGIGGGTPGAFVLGEWAAQVPYIGPYLGVYLAGRDDLSHLTPGDEGYARSEVYERVTGSATWRLVASGDPITGLAPGAVDFTGSAPSRIDSGKFGWERSDAAGNGRRHDLRNPNLLADNQDHKIVVETSFQVRAGGGEIGGRPEINFYSRQELGPTISTVPSAPPPNVAEYEVIVRGVRPDRSTPFRGIPSGMPAGVPFPIEMPSWRRAAQEWAPITSSPVSDFRPEREAAPHDERSLTEREPEPRDEQSWAGRIWDGLRATPATPFSLIRDVELVVAIAKAFNAEKTFAGGVAMGINVVNPLYHAEVARFESGEAADRGDYGAATVHGLLAAVGYLQALGIAFGAARGVVRPGPALPIRGPAPPVPSPAPPPVPGPAAASRASIPITALGRVGQITSGRAFRRYAVRAWRDPAHPLHRLLDPATRRLRPSSTSGITQLDWFEDPRIVEAGHWSSAKALGGAAARLIVMSAYENRLASAIIEHPSIGGFLAESGRVVAIGGWPVDLLTAEALVEFGALDADIFARAPLVTY